jgi:hypothetical protein
MRERFLIVLFLMVGFFLPSLVLAGEKPGGEDIDTAATVTVPVGKGERFGKDLPSLVKQAVDLLNKEFQFGITYDQVSFIADLDKWVASIPEYRDQPNIKDLQPKAAFVIKRQGPIYIRQDTLFWYRASSDNDGLALAATAAVIAHERYHIAAQVGELEALQEQKRVLLALGKKRIFELDSAAATELLANVESAIAREKKATAKIAAK